MPLSLQKVDIKKRNSYNNMQYKGLLLGKFFQRQSSTTEMAPFLWPATLLHLVEIAEGHLHFWSKKEEGAGYIRILLLLLYSTVLQTLILQKLLNPNSQNTMLLRPMVRRSMVSRPMVRRLIITHAYLLLTIAHTNFYAEDFLLESSGT